ncbi:S1C family serine protease [Limobrevibacterium gyesilva]|uniref:S1C family serine protease n=1 Tax=Limobrevibacterium gyesilva TaxID=2991712 RepID=A0AA41YJ33_9PROT|nr:S1C family serine protease [Limobrevibacterium gyesilva]MCW3474084.1 S1C family serine protease [Limobrevibacterium gyesilva]
MQKTEWEIPLNLQPDPDDYDFDLERALRAVVGVRANVPADAFTASTLGTERTGNGVVIRAEGLVLTIGYLVTEAETVWLITADGRAVPGHPLAYDQATGFGIVQALGKLDLPALELGDSESIPVGAEVVVAAGGGRPHAIETKVVGRQEFAGYWEYLIDNAIFTSPAHPFWSGSALIGRDGRLLGIGSLILQQGDGKRRMDMNMIVPVALLRPVLDELLATGRSGRSPRPWLGMYAMEGDGGLIVGGLADDGPAARAGVQAGDRILAVGDEEVTELASLWRKVWASGNAGSTVLLRLGRDAGNVAVRVKSADRASYLRAPRLH